MAAAKPNVRCPWCLKGNELYVDYHDCEWGVPAWDDQTQFEFLILEGAQAGLSWSTILNKRAGYARCFADFDPVRIAAFGDHRPARSTVEVSALPGGMAVEVEAWAHKPVAQ